MLVRQNIQLLIALIEYLTVLLEYINFYPLSGRAEVGRAQQTLVAPEIVILAIKLPLKTCMLAMHVKWNPAYLFNLESNQYTSC